MSRLGVLTGAFGMVGGSLDLVQGRVNQRDWQTWQGGFSLGINTLNTATALVSIFEATGAIGKGGLAALFGEWVGAFLFGYALGDLTLNFLPQQIHNLVAGNDEPFDASEGVLWIFNANNRRSRQRARTRGFHPGDPLNERIRSR